MESSQVSWRVISLLAGALSLLAGALSLPAITIVMAIVTTMGPARADEQADGAFAKRFCAGDAGKAKAYACFVRHYDAAHMAQHPQQKVTMMKLLITAEKTPDDQYLSYSFRLGVNFRDQAGDFDSSGDCGHAPPVRNADTDPMPPAGIDFACDVDCDGGGINVTLADNDNALIAKLDRIRIWKGTDPDNGPIRSLQGGADDKIFRLDRTSLDECKSLIIDRKELAALRRRK
jgi:hypothetical protein